MYVGAMVLTETNIYSVPFALRVPIAAADVSALRHFVGNAQEVLEGRTADERLAYVVNLRVQPGPLPETIVKLGRTEILHEWRQFWVHVDCDDYRALYRRAIGATGAMCLDHVFNRKLAREYGYRYLRLVPVDRPVNSSGGRGLETFSVNQQVGSRTPLTRQCTQPVPPRSQIAYAGPFAICKMINRMPGDTQCLPGVQQVIAAMSGA